MKFIYFTLCSLFMLNSVYASEEARGSGAMLSHLDPVNIHAPAPSKIIDAATLPEPLKFDLYHFQKVALAEEAERLELAKNPPPPTIVVVNPQAPVEQDNPLVSVLKFGAGILTRGLIRF